MEHDESSSEPVREEQPEVEQEQACIRLLRDVRVSDYAGKHY